MITARSTKEQILELLKKSGNMTILELSHELSITEMAVRRHIQTLEREKLIRSEVKKQTMGRPSKVYQLAEQGENYFPKKYKEFCLELLNGMKETGHEQLIIEILQKRKKRLLENYKNEKKSEDFSGKLESLMRIQELEGYMPQIDHENEKVHFKELNCPFVDIAKAFPEICTVEMEFIKDFLDINQSNCCN